MGGESGDERTERWEVRVEVRGLRGLRGGR